MYKLVCKFCGKEFESNHPLRSFCKRPHYLNCAYCGKSFNVDKNLDYYYRNKDKACCSKSCASKLVHSKETQEHKDQVRKKYLNTMISRYGVINPGQMQSVLDKRKITNLKKFGTEYANQSESVKLKTKQTNLKRYGVAYTFQSEEVKDKIRKTIKQKYGEEHISKTEYFKDKLRKTSKQKYGVDYHIASDCVRSKSKQTCIEKYGVDNPFKCKEFKEKSRKTCIEKYGVDHHNKNKSIKRKAILTSRELYGTDYPQQSPEIRKKIANSAKKSMLEIRVANLLEQYNIEYETQYVIKKDNHIHTFDFYIPKYKILLDADGVYYHSYLSDADGKHVRDDYDDVRMYLVPSDHIFMLAVEGNEEKTIKQLYDTIKKIDKGIFDYEGELFEWCREVGFPYPSYTDKRMQGDWNKLCAYENHVYKPTCRIGMSIIGNFHRSIYDCRVGNCKSPKEAWEDDVALKRVIANRLIYQNTVNPSKILSGFNICKEAPIVSRFNPILAKYLVNTYLNEYNEVFDPFSGFSGRLLGVASTGKSYIGQDIRQTVIDESNEIINYLNIGNYCSVECKDIFDSKGKYECLLTCSPYDKKEIYGQEKDFMNCDDWIDICLQRFECRRYVFVVDTTEKYKDKVVMQLSNSSHFSKSKEQVIVLK